MSPTHDMDEGRGTAGFEAARVELGLDDLRRRRKATAAILISVVVLALFFWLVPLGLDRDFHHRTSKSTASMGYRGLHDLLAKLGQDVQRLRRPYRELPRADESLLLVLDPFDGATLRRHGRARFDHEQWRDLHDWIRAGGNAVVVLPTWEATELAEDFGGVHLRPNAARAVLEEPPPGDWNVEIPEVDDGSWLHRSWFSLGKDPMLFAFGEDMGTWPVPMEEWKRHPRFFAPYWSHQPAWQGGKTDSAPWMQFFMRPYPEGYAMRAELAGETLLLTRNIGDGRVWVLSSGWPLTNLALAKGNTSWFAWKLLDEASGGFERQIVFDEFSHGDTDTRGIFGWLRESGVLYPLLALGILFLLAAWRGTVRIGAPATGRMLPRRAKEEFVVGLASLLHSQDRRRFVAESLIEESRHRLETVQGFSHTERSRRVARLKQYEEATEELSRLSYADLQRLSLQLDALLRNKETEKT